MAKSSEFDQPIISNTSAKNYSTPTNKKLFYITRARVMYKLTFIYIGERTKSITD